MRHLLALLLVAGCVDDGTATEPVETEDQTPGDPTTPPPQDPTTPGESPAEVLARWQTCMTFADFQAANMAGAWTTVTTTAPTGMKCAGCHAQAGNGFITTTNAQLFFDVIKNDVYMLRQFVNVAGVASQPGAWQVVVNEQTIPGVGVGDIPEHPRFNPAVGMTALRDFYQRTQARCASPL